jgi:hypothetical protein
VISAEPTAEQIERDLAAATRRHARSVTAAEEAALERDELVRAAIAAKVPRSRIISVTGLSPARVEQIKRHTR